MMGYVYTAVFLLLFLGGLVSYVQKADSASGAENTAPAVVVEAGQSKAEPWYTYLHATGTLKAHRGVSVTSEVSGRVTSIAFSAGDQIKAGQVLLRLNDNTERAVYQNKKASLDLARLAYERDAALLKKKSISKSQYDQSRAAMMQAEAGVEEAQAALDNKTIKAPFSGVVGIREVQLGEYIVPGTLIATLQDRSELELDFYVPEQTIPYLSKPLPVEFTVAAYPDQTFKAVITAINPVVDEQTRNIKVRAKVKGSDLLLPGMFAELKVRLGEREKQVTIPETAVTYTLHGNTVYVVESAEAERDLTVKPVIVKTGVVRDGRVAVIAGLQENMMVVTAGQNKLYPGAKIQLDPGAKIPLDQKGMDREGSQIP